MKKTKISGGILFALLTEIRITNENRSNRMNGISEPCTNLDLIHSLGGIISKEYPKMGIAKKTASTYKTCEGQGGLDFNTVKCAETFNMGITKYYDLLYKRTSLMVQKCLVNDENRRKLFTSKLLYILENASNLEEAFYYYPNQNNKINIKELTKLTEFDFIALILAVWESLIYNVQDNKVGAEMFNKFFKIDNKKSEYFFKDEYLIKLRQNFKLINNISELEPIIIDESEFHDEENSTGEAKINTEYYETYLKNYVKKISKLKTILYLKQPVDFYHVYVCNDICLDTNFNVPNDNSRKPLKSATPKQLVNRYGRFLTLSAPGGYGKSMFLKHMMLCEYRFKETDGVEHCGLVPVLLTLKDFKKNHNSIKEFIFEKLYKYDSNMDFKVFEKDLTKGIFMFLFDALDEINNELVYNFISQLIDFSHKYDSNVYILSSRPNNLSDSLTNFTALKLMHFCQQQAIKLINHFNDFPEEKRTSFKKRMFSNPEVRFADSTVDNNPLLLTIKFLLYIQTGEFVKSETSTFYEKAYEVLYTTHDQVHSQYSGRKYYTNLDQDNLAYAIGELCCKMYFKFKYSFSRNEIDDVVKEGELAIKYDLKTQSFIKDLKDNLTIIYFEDGKYSFIHKSFQEFFTAYYLSKQKKEFFTPAVVSSFADYSINKHNNKKESKNEKTFFIVSYYECEIANVLNIFYQFKPERVEENLFLPQLKEIFEKHDDQTVIRYIEYVYEKLTYTENYFHVQNYNEPKSEIVKFIIATVLKKDPHHTIENGPVYIEFIESCLYIENNHTIEIDNEPRKEYSKNDQEWRNIEADGYSFELKIQDIINQPSKYSELFLLLDDEFSEEQKVMKDYYIKLKTKYQKP